MDVVVVVVVVVVAAAAADGTKICGYDAHSLSEQNSILAQRLAEKNVPKMAYFVWSGM